MNLKRGFRIFAAEIKRRKEGIIIGGLVGIGLAHYAIFQGYDLNTIVQAGEGLIDSFMGRSSTPVDMAQFKVYGTFSLIGATAGYYLDIVYDKVLFLPRRRRR